MSRTEVELRSTLRPSCAAGSNPRRSDLAGGPVRPSPLSKRPARLSSCRQRRGEREYRRGGRGGDKFSGKKAVPGIRCSGATGRLAERESVAPNKRAGGDKFFRRIFEPLMQSPRAPTGSPQASRSAQTREGPGVRGGKEFETSGCPSPAPSGHPLPIEVQEWGEDIGMHSGGCARHVQRLCCRGEPHNIVAAG